MDFTGFISQDLYRTIEDDRNREWCGGRWGRAWQRAVHDELSATQLDQRLPDCEPERRTSAPRTPRIA